MKLILEIMLKKFAPTLFFFVFAIAAVAQQKPAAKPQAVPGPVSGEEIKWVSINDLPALQAKQPRKYFVDVYTSWCGPCKMMMNNTFKDPAIVKYVNENFYAVKFNAEGNEVVNFKGYEFKNVGFDPAKVNSRNGTHDFTLAIAPVQTRIAYPTLVYFDENNTILAPIQGYFQPTQLQPVLTYFKENKHKEIDLNTYLQQNTPKQ